jgi:hypothetical protein
MNMGAWQAPLLPRNPSESRGRHCVSVQFPAMLATAGRNPDPLRFSGCNQRVCRVRVHTSTGLSVQSRQPQVPSSLAVDHGKLTEEILLFWNHAKKQSHPVGNIFSPIYPTSSSRSSSLVPRPSSLVPRPSTLASTLESPRRPPHMSRTMSWLRSAGSPLGHGTKHLLHGNLFVPAWGAPTSVASLARRIAKDRTPRILVSVTRSLATQRTVKNSGQGSRFQRSSASPAETPADAAAERRDAEFSSTTANADESGALAGTQSGSTPLSTPSARPGGVPQAGSRAAPPSRKPIDTSSKEYKQTASRYVRFVVALPLLIVTSYYLYERREYSGSVEQGLGTDMNGIVAKDLNLRIRQVPAGSSSSQEPSTES